VPRRPIATRLLIASSLVALAPGRASARDEGILELHADLSVEDDATVAVGETILVWVADKRIAHGITWDIPTRYRDRRGARRAAGLRSLKVTRDGQPEPFQRIELRDGERLRIGDPEVTLEPGTHVYVISYRALRQVTFLADHDELYVPVVAGGREFPITQAAAVVHLPDGPAQRLESTAAFLAGGAGERSFAADRRGLASVFTVTRPLDAGESLAALVTWPKGLLRAPSAADEIADFVGDNRHLALALLAGIAQLAFLLAARGRLGRRAAVTPAAVEGVSPALLRFVLRRGRADARALAAALVDAVDAGALSVARGEDGAFVVARASAAPGELPPETQAAVDALLGAHETVRLDGPAAAAARSALRRALAEEEGEGGRYLVPAAGQVAPGIALSLVVLGAVAASARGRGAWAWAVLLGAALLVWIAVVIGMGIGCVRLWARAASRGYPSELVRRALLGSLLTAPFLAVALAGLALFGGLTSPGGAVALTATSVLDRLLFRSRASPTEAGRALIAGAAAYRAAIASGAAHRRAHAVAVGVREPWSDALVEALVRS
jgi:hypothetical protein